MVEAFLKADKERQNRQNQEAWLQGLYFYDGLSCAIANAFKKESEQPSKYPEQPYDIFQEEKNDRTMTEQEMEEQEEQERLQARLYMQQMVWAGKNWGGS